MLAAAQMTIKTEQVDLLSVAGQIDDAGLRQLQQRVDLLLDSGARFVATDLSHVTGCDTQLLGLLARTSYLLEHRGGWLRLVGLASSVLNTLDDAALPEVLLVYRASDWATRASVEHDRRDSGSPAAAVQPRRWAADLPPAALPGAVAS